ncbi:NAD(P)-dependent oxidoreductase [Elizabethkingia meningoseptica]|uniref:NAD(P)-dependent oxidoreductase n=1 Tax=Elizabethkingia meningoseptica TaxID=238 RepID=UPI002010D947|nr:NAD(P)-dependent oxidoreductase [Elizabethkingia meningoseptica]MCL1674560.1 NAD(P)-dependent oxidoreductase [Elizabethkingia meningoseptica]MCL1686241.1 NAD(P)-dependent oxidoreductase [Elizabethkingia meningoseptica]MDE5437543.1 NAD(P)-dependent oxidoreductase [Elizabethkingia meningoseptica]MDE5491076.1 NAD(P)-dependent oxidoreductase [Elizabethkingia meningoseptica]MDE5507359.1 NAD(P)-dependent oxidoreductase [Elizabethkingia meningoseptica]
MKVAVIGATGFVGSHIVNELASRNNEVTAISRNTNEQQLPENVKTATADVNNIEKLAEVLKGNDVVISAFNAGWTNPNLYNDFLLGSKSIQQAVKDAGVKRLIVVGGAGSLLIDGKKVIDGPDFPEAYKPGAQAASDYLDILRNEQDLDWTFFSPALAMNPGNPGERTGKYRTGLDNPVFDAEGQSYLSVADTAVVLADEAENPKHIKQRFTAAY